MKKADKKRIQEETELDNYARELEKADNALELVEQHLHATAKANATLHCDDEILFSPLYTQVVGVRNGIKTVLRKYKRKVPKESVDEAHAKDVKADEEAKAEAKE